MSQLLIDKIKKAREFQVAVDHWQFTCRRPTDLEQALMDNGSSILEHLLQNYVVGWNLTEADLIAGGTPKPVEFSSALFLEWVADQPKVWQPIGLGIRQAYQQHMDAIEDALKKPENG